MLQQIRPSDKQIGQWKIPHTAQYMEASTHMDIISENSTHTHFSGMFVYSNTPWLINTKVHVSYSLCTYDNKHEVFVIAWPNAWRL